MRTLAPGNARPGGRNTVPAMMANGTAAGFSCLRPCRDEGSKASKQASSHALLPAFFLFLLIEFLFFVLVLILLVQILFFILVFVALGHGLNFERICPDYCNF